ncbi:MAG: 2,3,4,5-tetrahydropyridine-2,6-dicarboxylate N-succinyltransferase [Amphiplicatus sp.]
MTDTTALARIIDAAWEKRADIGFDTKGEIRDAVDAALEMLDSGAARVAEPVEAAGANCRGWRVNQWLKKAVLLSFRLNDNRLFDGAPGPWWDKVPTKFASWTEENFRKAGFRAVPPATVRRGAYVAPSAVLMPCYVNIGAYVGEGTMIDTWATVGSCAQIGANCHISGGVGIGGVLEPLQANPVIVEDHVFIGARSEVAEGVIVREGAVLSMGVYLGASTKIVDRATGEVLYGEIPPYAVVVPGASPSDKGGPSLYCAVIVKRVDEKTRAKTSVNELLRG